jgi:hypothetical protein
LIEYDLFAPPEIIFWIVVSTCVSVVLAQLIIAKRCRPYRYSNDNSPRAVRNAIYAPYIALAT